MLGPIVAVLFTFVQRALCKELVPRVALPATNPRRPLSPLRAQMRSTMPLSSSAVPPRRGPQHLFHSTASQTRAPALRSSSGLGAPGLPRQWEEPLRQPQGQTDQYHRWITREDPTFQDSIFLKQYGGGYLCETPEQYFGTRKKGDSPGSSRVEFTLLGEDAVPQTIEFLHSNEKDNPSFGAVRVKLPADARVVSRNSRLVVEKVGKGSNADNSRLRQGDIIRAISLPQAKGDKADAPWWARLGQRPVPEAENGMVMLDGRSVGDLQAVMDENFRVAGNDAEVVMLIERPAVMYNDDDGFVGRGGRPSYNKRYQRDRSEELIPELMPIPIPVEEPNGFPPNMFPPNQPGGTPNYPDVGPLRSSSLGSGGPTPPTLLMSEDSNSGGVAGIHTTALALAPLLVGASAAAVASWLSCFSRRRSGTGRGTKEPLLAA